MDNKNIFHSNKITNNSLWVYEVDSPTNPNDVLSKITNIMTTIEKQSTDSWPTDDNWKLILPKWFVNSFVNLSQEEARVLLANTPKSEWSKLPWDFGSWLDAIRVKGWICRGIEQENNRILIKLEIIEWPASLEAFEKIVIESRGNIIRKGWI